jgi:hypothetical protein
MSICRLLITLEQFISKYSTEIHRLFTSSLAQERKKIGSSNDLLTVDNLNFLALLKHHLKDRIVQGELPKLMLGVARSFVNDFDQLIQGKVVGNSSEVGPLNDVEMPQV